MILYHGSNVEVSKPDLSYSRENVDFGKGFYVTPIYEQAAKWSERYKRRGEKGIITKYSFDENLYSKFSILRFDTYSEEWLDFVMNCRLSKDNTNYDIVIGGVANDKVFNTVELYFEQLIDKGEALKRLRYEKTNLQICFRKQELLDKYLLFEGSESV